jgi:cytochrome P450
MRFERKEKLPFRLLKCNRKIIIYIMYKYLCVHIIGKHRCMGQTLARSNIFLFSACLLQNFDFSVPAGQAPPSTLGVDGVTPSPGEFSAYVSLRS